MTGIASAPANVRNSRPIFGVLADELKDCRRLLEIGSGTGLHAVTFAPQLPHIVWQTSDLEERHADIRETLEAARLDNVLPPLRVDVRDAELPAGSYDAVYSCNTAHIMSRAAAFAMLRLASHVLEDRGVFCCYGPFRRDGQFNTPSNAEFDAALRYRDPVMGIRDLNELDGVAGESGLRMRRLYAMPANNLIVVWVRRVRKRE